MNKFRKTALLFCFFYFGFFLKGMKSSNAQQTFRVDFQFPDNFKPGMLKISYDDGISDNDVGDSLYTNKNVFTLSPIFFGEYATLTLKFFKNDSEYSSRQYFINTEPAKFIFTLDSENVICDSFLRSQIINAREIKKLDIYSKRNLFNQRELKDFLSFLDKNGSKMYKVDSLKKEFHKKFLNINQRDLQFIKENKYEYFSFWWFRTQIIPAFLNNSSNKDSIARELIDYYDTVFPKQVTESAEGKHLKYVKLGGILETVKNRIVRNFSAVDIKGEKIELNDFRGKYVLLDFWATWCPPCMAQIPFLKELRTKYADDDLKMISISADTDYNEFQKVIAKREMNWIHIYDKSKIPELFGINAYPTLLLISPSGKITFDGKSEDNKVLEGILEKIKKSNF